MTTPITIDVTVSARVLASNGTEVTVGTKSVVLHKPGARGGDGPKITIPIDEWDAINRAVVSVRDAIDRARDAVEERITS